MSTFASMFSDFQDQTKAYTEKLDITELSFMRMFTRGMQEFQRETEYMEMLADITRLAPPNPPIFMIPDDCIRVVQLRGKIVTPCGQPSEEIFLLQGHDQHYRNMEKWKTGQLETPVDYAMRIPDRVTVDGKVRLASIWQREIWISPEWAGDTITCWYIPNIDPIDIGSPQWAAWFPAGIYDDTFLTMFNTLRIHPSLAIFEQAFLDYALAMYIKSKGSANYKVFEESFYNTAKRAIEIKPIYNKEMVASYMFAPWS